MPIPILVKMILWTAYLISLYFVVFWLLVLLDSDKKSKAKGLNYYPKVTIAVPAYNEEKNITPTLESVIRLDYPKEKMDIIVINDGSTDQTKQVIEDFISKCDHEIRLINKKNEGKGAALNAALKLGKGEFFICLDADSFASRNAIKKILPHFTSKDIAVVLPIIKVSRPKNIWQKMQWLEYTVNMFYKKLMGRLNCIHVSPGPFSVYRKDILEKIGGFDAGNLTEDLEITLRLQSRNYRIIQLLDAEVFTIAPKSFMELYRQRNRWYKGSILNAFRYKRMIFNKNFGDFGIMQMPTIIISGIVAIVLILSMAYYGLKPHINSLYNLFFVDFDVYTLIKSFQMDFNLLDLDYMAILTAIIMFSISLFVLRKSHREANETAGKHGIFSLTIYFLFYFIILGFIWVGILADFLMGRKQRW